MTHWFSRPLLLVRDVEAALAFYTEALGFTEAWRHVHEGRAIVAQVERLTASAILAEQWPDRVGQGVLFITINAEPQGRDGEIAAARALKTELEAKGVPLEQRWWGYDLLVVKDPDGNELLFPDPDPPNEGGS